MMQDIVGLSNFQPQQQLVFGPVSTTGTVYTVYTPGQVNLRTRTTRGPLVKSKLEEGVATLAYFSLGFLAPQPDFANPGDDVICSPGIHTFSPLQQCLQGRQPILQRLETQERLETQGIRMKGEWAVLRTRGVWKRDAKGIIALRSLSKQVEASCLHALDPSVCKRLAALFCLCGVSKRWDVQAMDPTRIPLTIHQPLDRSAPRNIRSSNKPTTHYHRLVQR